MTTRELRFTTIGFTIGLLTAAIVSILVFYASRSPAFLSFLAKLIPPYPHSVVLANNTKSLSIVKAERIGERYAVTIMNNSDLPVQSVKFAPYKDGKYTLEHSTSRIYMGEHGNLIDAHKQTTIHMGSFRRVTTTKAGDTFIDDSPPVLACIVFHNGTFEGDPQHLGWDFYSMAETRKTLLLIKQNLDSLSKTYPNNPQMIVSGLYSEAKNNYKENTDNWGASDAQSAEIQGKNNAYRILTKILEIDPKVPPDKQLEIIKSRLGVFVNKLQS